MKKIFILAIALIAFIVGVKAQNGNMTVIKTNGDVSTYIVDTIDEIYYADTHPSDEEWTSLGYCLYSEDFIASAFYISKQDDLWCEYYVEVQEKNDTPGLYRLVNPYSPDVYPIVSEYPEYFSYDSDNFHYIEINATAFQYRTNAVYIECQDTGLTINSNALSGRIFAYSDAAALLMGGDELGDIREDGISGTLVDGVITFPHGQLTTIFGVPLGVTYYFTSRSYGNYYNKFKLDLNDKNDTPGPKDARKKIKANGKEPSLNLNSIKTDGALQLKH